MDDKVIFARAMPAPVDVAVDGHFAGKLDRALRFELHAWALIAVVALGLAGLLALVLALARAPGVEKALPFLDQAFFQRGLVAHVTFAFVVWYLAVQGALTVLVTGRLVPAGRPMPLAAMVMGRAGLVAAAASFLLLLLPVLTGRGAASANNYIPVMNDPLYYAGLCMLAAGLALPVVRLLMALARLRHVEATTFAVGCAGAIYLLALACFLLAWTTRPQGFDPEGLNEYLMWGGGHVLQFANTALFLGALYLLARVAFGETPLSARLFKATVLLLVAGAAVGPPLYLTYAGGDPAQRQMFTDLYRFVLPLPAAAVCGAVAALFARRWRDVWDGAPEIRGAVAALVLFACGGVIGFFESSVDTRTPAHYHAMLIAVTLIFMALTFAVFLPVLDRRAEARRLRTAMYLMLGIGTLIQASGLFIAGALGVARKTAGAAQGLDSTPKIVAIALNAGGGAVAAVGGVIFIVLAGKLLLAKRGRGVTAASLAGTV
jgi:hypothetical protein